MAEYFGYAKNPMIRRVVKIDNSIPIWFIYGSRSWIDQSAGFIAIYNRPESILTAVKVRIKFKFKFSFFLCFFFMFIADNGRW